MTTGVAELPTAEELGTGSEPSCQGGCEDASSEVPVPISSGDGEASRSQGFSASGEASVQAKPPRSRKLRQTQQPGLPWLIKVQATCVIPRLDPQREDRTLCQQPLILRRKVQLGPAFGRAEIVVERLIAFSHQGKAAVAALQRRDVLGRVQAETS